MKDKKKLIVLIVMLLMPVAGIWYFIKMSLKYMKGAEIEIFFPNNFFKQFGVWSIIWIILWIIIMFIERKYKVKKIKERKNSIKILQCIVMFVMAVISFWIYVSVLTGKKIKDAREWINSFASFFNVCLLYSYRFSQVSWLVYIISSKYRDMISK